MVSAASSGSGTTSLVGVVLRHRALVVSLGAAVAVVPCVVPVSEASATTPPVARTAACGPTITDSSAPIEGGHILNAIAAAGPQNVWSVGVDADVPYRPRARHWDGSEWRRVPAHGPAGASFLDVTTVGQDEAWAVGDYGVGALTQHWDGSSWRLVRSPTRPGDWQTYLRGVDAGGGSDVWAVGYAEQRVEGVGKARPYALHWDGSSWARVQMPGPRHITRSEIVSVTVVSADDAWAVGAARDYPDGPDQGLIEHWDGSSWSIVKGPDVLRFTAVTAVATDDVWAVGYDGENVVLEHWDGQAWSLATPPALPGTAYPRDMSAVSADDVWMVGDTVDSHYRSRFLIEHWNGTEWSVVKAPRTNADGNSLRSVSADSATDAWAVGYSGTGDPAPVVLHWDGVSWRPLTH